MLSKWKINSLDKFKITINQNVVSMVTWERYSYSHYEIRLSSTKTCDNLKF